MPRARTTARQKQHAEANNILRYFNRFVPHEMFRTEARRDQFLRNVTLAIGARTNVIRQKIMGLPYCNEAELHKHLSKIIISAIEEITEPLPKWIERFFIFDSQDYSGLYFHAYTYHLVMHGLLEALARELREAHEVRASSHAWLAAKRNKLCRDREVSSDEAALTR